jgi:hypothetical protein
VVYVRDFKIVNSVFIIFISLDERLHAQAPNNVYPHRTAIRHRDRYGRVDRPYVCQVVEAARQVERCSRVKNDLGPPDAGSSFAIRRLVLECGGGVDLEALGRRHLRG